MRSICIHHNINFYTITQQFCYDSDLEFNPSKRADKLFVQIQATSRHKQTIKGILQIFLKSLTLNNGSYLRCSLDTSLFVSHVCKYLMICRNFLPLMMCLILSWPIVASSLNHSEGRSLRFMMGYIRIALSK